MHKQSELQYIPALGCEMGMQDGYDDLVTLVQMRVLQNENVDGASQNVDFDHSFYLCYNKYYCK